MEYICRPPVATERLSINPHTGMVHYKLKSQFSDGTTHVSWEPVEFLGRLASLVPPPRLNLIRFSGVFAPNSRHRQFIVPKPKDPDLFLCKPHHKYQPPWVYLLKRTFQIDLDHCPLCGKGKMKIISEVMDNIAIAKILSHIGLPTEPPKIHGSRAPPEVNGNPDFDEYFQPSYDDL